MTTNKISLTGMTRDESLALLAKWGEKPFRARQLWSWIYQKAAPDIGDMTELSKALRERLAAECLPIRPLVKDHLIGADGTQKWLLELADGQVIETVFIPEKDRGTLCISSQVGCSLTCQFCCTGAQGFARNLTTGEIVEQVLTAKNLLAETANKITNIVLMGMGEPLYNYDAVVKAVTIFMDGHGLNFGTRKITLSTVGMAPKLSAVGRALGVNLAISLHSVRDEVRDKLVPLNRKYNLAALRQAVVDFPLKSTRRITWEYVLLAGVNDSAEDAEELVRYLRGIPSKVNLIPFNPWPGSDFTPSSATVARKFRDLVANGGVTTVVRQARGDDIAAACGQLRGEVVSAKKSN